MKRLTIPQQAVPIVFPRADPAELANFDPSTKRCTMNCGPHDADPRDNDERKFLCDDCELVPPPKPAPLIYPATLTLELEHALGFMNFQTGQMAHVYRAAGHNIATKCEAEQAFILDRMVRTVITHGDKWLDAFAADIRTAQEAAKERLAAPGMQPAKQENL